MVQKVKAPRRSLAKHHKSAQNNLADHPAPSTEDFLQLSQALLNGSLDELIEKEIGPVDPELLAKYTPVAQLIDEMHALATGDSEKDEAVLNAFLAKHEDHPLSMRLHLEMTRMLLQSLSPDEQKQLHDVISNGLLPAFGDSLELDKKITSTLDLARDGHTVQAKANIIECIQQIEAMNLPEASNEIQYVSLKTPYEDHIFAATHPFISRIEHTPAMFDAAYAIYGTILSQEDRIQDAIEAFKASIKWNPVNPITLLQLARMYHVMDNHVDHERLLLEAYPLIDTPRLLGEFYFELATIHYMKKNKEIAARLYQLAQILNKDLESDVLLSDLRDFEFPRALRSNKRTTFIKKFKEFDIPFGASQTAIDNMRGYADSIASSNKAEAARFRKKATELERCLDFVDSL